MYVNNYFEYERNKTTEVFIGDIPLGKTNPVRIQTMTNTDTSDIEATVNQITEIAEAGAEYVRLTVQTEKIAKKLNDIKEILKEKKCDIPLIADIHFSPKAAETAAKIVEKVRINPGNYTDTKKFRHIDYTDEEYEKEIEKIREKFVPLLNICKKHNTAIRTGTNHGSLSDRILSRYGDTPKGMTESTMEFLRICKEENFNDVVISMKASNPLVMIYAVRLLVKTMKKEKMNFPLHLGVTEAGNDIEGRIKSAVGIASLLADGIGDTVRVSLTESPVKEIPVAKKITEIFSEKKLSEFKCNLKIKNFKKNFYDYEQRKTDKKENIGGENVPVVISQINETIDLKELEACGYKFNGKNPIKSDTGSDYIFLKNPTTKSEFSGINFITNRPVNKKSFYEIKQLGDKTVSIQGKIYFLEIKSAELSEDVFSELKQHKNAVFVLNLDNVPSVIHSGRVFFAKLSEYGIKNPVIFKLSFDKIDDYAIIKSSGGLGALFVDGFGNGIWINTNDKDTEKARELSFGILQAVRTRITKTEYISCPGCGRTLFDLEKTTAKIKKATSHLKGVKIAVMGCIVNGPGEMADADFGYVGTGTGKITLYKNKETVKRNIPEKQAVEELLKLIEQNI